MDRRHRLIFITLIESIATVLIERGLYFYTHDLLEYSDAQNLWLALSFGVCYVGGALVSHPITQRTGERRALALTLLLLLAAHVVMALAPRGSVLVIGFVMVAALSGLKWPIIESYVTAGQTPAHTLRIIGRFNVSWATGVPIGVAASGLLIGSSAPWLLFAAVALIHALTLLLIRWLPARPSHLPHDHPERPDVPRLARYRALLSSSRWSMLASYALLFLLAPLLPTIFRDLGLSVELATQSASLMDVVRVIAFGVMWWWIGWRERAMPLFGVLLALPVGFFMVLFGPNLPVVLMGEVLFGAASGVTYYAALYYVMVVKNASVDAGGAHEGWIGLGFTLGPLVGLIGIGLAEALDGYVAGMLIGVAPLILVCAIGALLPLRRA